MTVQRDVVGLCGCTARLGQVWLYSETWSGVTVQRDLVRCDCTARLGQVWLYSETWSGVAVQRDLVRCDCTARLGQV